MATKQRPLTLAVNPGKGLGFMLLGGSLKDILTRLLEYSRDQFPSFKIQSTALQPLSQPMIIYMPENGLRLSFDAAEQRLRLIEVMDFGHFSLTYKDQDLVKHQGARPSAGPSFKHIYGKLFGPTFEGTRTPGTHGSASDGYILSYPGVGFTFNISSQTADTDFVSILSAPSTSPAIAMSIFVGASWDDARRNLYTRTCPHPRSLAIAERPKDSIPDEIELAIIKGRGEVEFRRRTLPPFSLILSKSTVQDLLFTLGPPDEIYQKNDRRMTIHKKKIEHNDTKDIAAGLENVHLDTDQSSINTATDFSSHEDESKAASKSKSAEYFYNYYDHGFDILMSQQIRISPPLKPDQLSEDDGVVRDTSPHIVATKIILHGNIPGSHDFHRYRRIRWALDPVAMVTLDRKTITSETPFPAIRAKLDSVWSEEFAEQDRSAGRPEQRHMVLNREWGASPSSSIEFLGGWEDGGEGSSSSIASLDKRTLIPGNTDLWAWPGLIFEVLKNDAVSWFTIY